MLFSGPDRTADEIGLNELHQTVIVEGRTNKNRGKACILDASRTIADLRELIQGFPDTKNFESWANLMSSKDYNNVVYGYAKCDVRLKDKHQI